MKKTGVLHRIICLMLAIFLIAVPAHATGEEEVSEEYNLPITQGCHTIDASIPMIPEAKNITNVSSAFLYDYNTETLLYSVNPDELCDPGSLVKIMTSLIIAEQANLDDEVTVDGSLLELLPEYSTGIDLQPGEIITIRELLYCIMVDSANDASVVAAHHVSGSIDAFVEEMNRYARDLGCTRTHFTNVHGLYDTLQFTTARDLTRILAYAVKNETFMEVFSTVHHSVPATNKSEIRDIASNNFLMNDDILTFYLDYRVTGGRAAVADSGERHLAVTAEQNGVELICIVMGSDSIFADDGYSVISYGSFGETSALLNLGFQGHYFFQLFHSNQVWQQFEVLNGDCSLTTGIRESVKALLPNGVRYDDLSYRYNDGDLQLQAPITAGEQIATVQVWYKNICLAVTDLYAMHDVNVKEFEPEAEIPVVEDTNTTHTLILIFSIIALLFILIFGRSLIFRIIRKRKLRHSKSSRRRNH